MIPKESILELKLVDNTTDALKTLLNVKQPEKIEVIHTILTAIYRAGIIIGYELKKNPREIAFMNVAKQDATIHPSCGNQVFPLWLPQENQLKYVRSMLWWCQNCGRILNVENITGKAVDSPK